MYLRLVEKQLSHIVYFSILLYFTISFFLDGNYIFGFLGMAGTFAHIDLNRLEIEGKK